MKTFNDLAELSNEEISALLELATRLDKHPEPQALQGKVLSLLFLSPSLRTLASFQAAMTRLGGGSFVISPDMSIHGLETRPGIVMDGTAAEHINEAVPVIASYGDAIGIRAFAERKNLEHDMAETEFNTLTGLIDTPWINMESAMSHPCQNLADWKTLDDLAVPANGGKFVLSWAFHPKALPLAVPSSTLYTAARRGMDVTVLRPEGFELPEAVMQRARTAAEAAGGSVQETDDRAEAMQDAHRPHQRPETEERTRRLVRRRALVRQGAGRLPLHALPPRASRSCRRRQDPGRAAQRRYPRSTQPHAGADGGTAPHARRQPMTSKRELAIVVSALKHAAPYIRLFKGKVFVLKAGGEIFADKAATTALMEQVGILYQVGIRVVLIHGGGPQSTQLAAALGVDTTFVDGRRVTDGDSLDVATMVLNGQINTRVLAACRDLQIPAVGISGVDAGLIRAHKRPPVEREGESAIDYGFVGDIDSVDADILRKQLDNGLMPVVSPLSCDESGTLLNINADTVAAAIAAELGAEKLILLTGAPGVLEDASDPHSLISYIDRAQLDKLRDDGKLADGMLPKAAAIDAALANGVQRVHVISYNFPDSLLLEVFTNEGTGTLVVNDIAALTPAEQAGGGS
jgi:acetylglutamate kinase